MVTRIIESVSRWFIGRSRPIPVIQSHDQDGNPAGAIPGKRSGYNHRDIIIFVAGEFQAYRVGHSLKQAPLAGSLFAWAKQYSSTTLNATTPTMAAIIKAATMIPIEPYPPFWYPGCCLQLFFCLPWIYSNNIFSKLFSISFPGWDWQMAFLCFDPFIPLFNQT